MKSEEVEGMVAAMRTECAGLFETVPYRVCEKHPICTDKQEGVPGPLVLVLKQESDGDAMVLHGDNELALCVQCANADQCVLVTEY